MNGTPSWSFGSSSPWKWIDGRLGQLVVRMTRTRSPSRTRICGPGTWPLYAHASTIWPGSVSHWIFFGGELEDLHAFVDPRLEQLVALARGLGRERLDALLVHRVHRVGLLPRRGLRRRGSHLGGISRRGGGLGVGTSSQADHSRDGHGDGALLQEGAA